tara:strand:- start:2953 stop:3393 length:441 start_codon:yes stop_codon:yes gene_type:complete
MNEFTVNFTLILLALFAVKHFICDFPLQNICNNIIIHYEGSPDFSKWFPVLVVHSSIHAAVTGLMLTLVFEFYEANLLIEDEISRKIGIILLAEFVLHLAIDRIKAHPNLGGRFRPDQIYFWWALGIDQLAHGLTYLLFVYYLLGN